MIINRDKSTQAPSKIEMSAQWKPEERTKLVEVLNNEIRVLDTEGRELRKTIHYEAPCLQQLSGKRIVLNELRDYAEVRPSRFLEDNRSKYAAYLTQ